MVEKEEPLSMYHQWQVPKLGNFHFNLAKGEIAQEFDKPKIKYDNRDLVESSMCTDNRLSKLLNSV